MSPMPLAAVTPACPPALAGSCSGNARAHRASSPDRSAAIAPVIEYTPPQTRSAGPGWCRWGAAQVSVTYSERHNTYTLVGATAAYVDRARKPQAPHLTGSATSSLRVPTRTLTPTSESTAVRCNTSTTLNAMASLRWYSRRKRSGHIYLHMLLPE